MQTEKIIIDAAGKVVGRLASQIAHHLRGKHRTDFAPHIAPPLKVIVLNAAQVRFSGKKAAVKIYRHYSGYPGGLKERSVAELAQKKPGVILRLAVERMLPKNRLRKELLKKLTIKP